MACFSAPTSAPNLRPSAAFSPQRAPRQYQRLHPSLHKVPPCTALLCPACTFVEPIMSQSGTRCFPGAPLVQISMQVGKGLSPAHHVPNACPGCPHHRNAAPIAGVCMGVGWPIGAYLQGVGVSGQTSRSQSDPFQDQIYRWKAHLTRVFVGSMIRHLHLRLRQHLLLVARRPSPVTEKPRQCVQQAHLIQSKTHTV